MSRAPQWSTQVATGVSGDRKRAPLQEKSLWKWTLKNGILQTAIGDLQAIQDLFNAMQGRWDYFLWLDPEGASIADPSQQINILGNSYWPVAFTHDSTDFDRFAYQLWGCGTLEFEQVGIPSGTLSNLQLPNGDLLSAVLSVKSANIASSNSVAGGTDISFGPWASGSGVIGSGGAYAVRTDTYAMPTPTVAGILGSELWVRDFQTLFLDAAIGSPNQLQLYDVSIAVIYTDGTTGTYKPTIATANDADPTVGSIVNIANAVDNDPSTFATINRTAFRPLADHDIEAIILSGFTQQ